jgi:hypothetical protein
MEGSGWPKARLEKRKKAANRVAGQRMDIPISVILPTPVT